MMGCKLVYFMFLQTEMVEPEGYKMAWVVSFIALIAFLYWLFSGKKIKWKTGRVKLELSKNKLYRPTNITMVVRNNSNGPVEIENPVIRFRRIRGSRAFKVKNINSRNIYPLYLDSGQSHDVTVAFSPFFQHDKKLKRFPRVRVEVKIKNGRVLKSKYVLRYSTLFRKLK